jgi:hypothetical protein
MQTDRDVLVYEDFHTKLAERIRALITDELIAEHEAQPLGQHSDTLERVLAFFRQVPITGKYIVVATVPWQEYRVAELSGLRSERLRLLDDEPAYPSEEAALHGIFLRRIRDLQEARP